MSGNQEENDSLRDNSQSQKQSEDENSPTWNRLKGFGKVGASWIAALIYVNTAPVTAPALAIGGAGMTVVGFGIKKISQAFGWEGGERLGAGMNNVGLKFLAAPAYCAGAFFDGMYSLFSGNEAKPGLVGRLNKATERLSGLDKLKAQERQGQEQSQNQGQSQGQGQSQSQGQSQGQAQAQSQEQGVGSPGYSSPSINQREKEEEEEKKKRLAPSYSAPMERDETKQSSSPRSVTSAINERQGSQSIDIVQAMKDAQDLEGANRVYRENTDNERKFKMVGNPVGPNANGEVTITWKPPGAVDNPDLHITLTYDKDKNVIAHKAGEKASAILPPVKDPSGTHSVCSYKDGILEENSLKAKNIANTLQKSGASVSVTSATHTPNNRPRSPSNYVSMV